MLPLLATKAAAANRGSATTKRAHVAVCSFFQPPHPETFFLLSRRIAAANPDVQVTMFTSVFYAMYLYWFWDPQEDQNLAIAAVGGWSSGSSDATLEEQIKAYLKEIGANLRESFTKVEEELEHKITYVVADAFLADVCREIAEERGIRWSAVWASSAASLAAYMHADELRRKWDESYINLTPGVPPVQNRALQPVDHYLPGFPPGVPLFDLPYGVLAPGIDESALSKMFHGMSLSLPKAEAVLMNSFHHLESSVAAALLNNKFHFGGLFSLILPFPPIQLDRTDDIFSWLDARLTSPASVVYINLYENYGSNPVLPLPQEELDALAKALEATGVSFLWYVAPLGGELPEGFVERTSKSGQGMVVSNYSWGPVRTELLQKKVLSHEAVGAQLRQGTWSSVTESVATGVPIICRPFAKLYDQALNATLVESVWGIGVAVEGGKLTKDTAERALKRVMVEEEGRKIRDKIGALKKLAEDAAAEPKGSSAQTLNKFISLVTK